MLICFMCGLKLPYNKNAVQYDVFEWACRDIKKKKADAVVCAGNFTADGNVFAAKRFVRKLSLLDIPAVVIPGKSDFRTCKNIPFIKSISSSAVTAVGKTKIVSVGDIDGTVDCEAVNALESADENTVAVMPFGFDCLDEFSKNKIECIRKEHGGIKFFCGNTFCQKSDDEVCFLGSADTDSSDGENPCITYYDTETKTLRKAYYFCPVPIDLPKYLGISCYNNLKDIDFAALHRLKCIELRESILDEKLSDVQNHIDMWREICGINLSMHAPEISYVSGMTGSEADWEKFIEYACALNADRITVHVPKITLETLKRDAEALDTIADFVAKRIALLPEKCVIGVENMHMTAKETESVRHFGYIPEECAEFMKHLNEKCTRKVGINLDIGHARNNAPYSDKYTVGVWCAELGKYAVGYHLHQVVQAGGNLLNHNPIYGFYGKTLSFASFFSFWNNGKINKAPVILEVKNSDYAKTIELFEREFARRVFDLHSHTLFSDCGRDKPEQLIAAAVSNGIKMLGISDHNYGIGERKQKYRDKIKDLSQKFSDKIKILCGIEIATLPNLYDIEDSNEISGYDYCLIEHILDDSSLAGANLIDFCRNLGIKCGIAHTDMFAYCEKYRYDPKKFFAEMAENGIFWEMNVSYDSIHFYREHSYVAEFMNNEEKQKIVRDSGMYVSVGFDSHRCEDYDGYRVHKMYDFLKEKNIKTADLLF